MDSSWNLVQWGCNITSSYSTERTVSYPISFGTVYSVIVGTKGQLSVNSYEGGIVSITKSSFTYYGVHMNTTADNGCCWIAVGK